VTLIQPPSPLFLSNNVVAPSLSTRLPSAATPTPASYTCCCSLLLSVSPFHFACYAYVPPSYQPPWTPFHFQNIYRAGQPHKAHNRGDKKWDADELLDWIQQKLPTLLNGDDLKKLKEERIHGVIFLNHAGDRKYFREECNLPIGTSEMLADLARKIAGGETAGIKSKLLSFIPCTPHRQQANNFTSTTGRRGFQGRNQVHPPKFSCIHERCELGISTTPGSIRDTCKYRSRTLHPLQER
jgi:hypothetical protein